MKKQFSEKTTAYCKTIFAKFDCLYPLWGKQFEVGSENGNKLKREQMYQVWCNLIEKLSDKAITEGMKAILDGRSSFTAYYPNPLQFYEYCRQFDSSKIMREVPRLEEKDPVKSAKVAKQIRELANKLRRGEKV